MDLNELRKLAMESQRIHMDSVDFIDLLDTLDTASERIEVLTEQRDTANSRLDAMAKDVARLTEERNTYESDVLDYERQVDNVSIERDALAQRVEELTRTVGMLRSFLRSGESLSAADEAEIDRRLATTSPEPALPTIEQVSGSIADYYPTVDEEPAEGRE